MHLHWRYPPIPFFPLTCQRRYVWSCWTKLARLPPLALLYPISGGGSLSGNVNRHLKHPRPPPAASPPAVTNSTLRHQLAPSCLRKYRPFLFSHHLPSDALTDRRNVFRAGQNPKFQEESELAASQIFGAEYGIGWRTRIYPKKRKLNTGENWFFMEWY